MAEKLLKQIKLNKRDLNGLRIIGLQAYGEKSYRDKQGYNKKSPYYDVKFYFLTEYKGFKDHKRVYGYNELLRLGEIQGEMRKIIRNEDILSSKGQTFAREQTARQSALSKNK